MNNKFKLFALLCIGIIMSYTSWNIYHYFFDDFYPEICLKGIEAGHYYAGNINGEIIAHDNYKISDISIFIDEKTLLNNHKTNSQTVHYPFRVCTETLENGKHAITIEATNGSYKANKTRIEHTFFVDNDPLNVQLIKQEPEYKVLQGRTLHVKLHLNKPIKHAQAQLLNTTYPCFPEAHHSLLYECFIPISCEEKAGEYPLHIDIVDFVGNRRNLVDTLQIVQCQFKRQQLSVDTERIKKEKELSLSNDQLEQEIEELTQKSHQKKLWNGLFYIPVDMRGISTEYGTIRITQEKGRYFHKAVDILGTPKSVVWAPQDGIVVMKNRYALSGNTVAIDHGCGILSLFFHLDDFSENLSLGAKIKRGNPIGTLGKTGYASGYHLHWEMRINNIAVDPMQWTNQNF